ncbi:glycosyltransferase [Roseimaritima sediminicola]|uniref:glycosyltransferase n=1 Tax=Roseimaritima sediminicola TaxID=2662066 RepID=UPI0013876308|nr:glycosyltransferase [Roseimaritima sediminicola]
MPSSSHAPSSAFASAERSPGLRASVILTTFRSPAYLDRVLEGFARQSTGSFDVVVGEDGCTASTRAVIRRHAVHAPFAIRYLGQPYRGFDKTRILNRAIQAATGPYLIFTDGDCVPRADFVQQHLFHARHGRFLSGGCCRLPRPLTQRILSGTAAYDDFTNLLWLKENGLAMPSKWTWIARHPRWAAWLDRATTTRASFNGHNASAWKADLVRVNGFNLQMRYGGLDRELGERLENAGIRGLQLRHRAIVYHLDHDRDYVRNSDWQRNAAIRKRVRRRGITRAEQGLAQVTTPLEAPQDSTRDAANAEAATRVFFTRQEIPVMDKKPSRTDLRNSADTQEQADQIFAALDRPATDLNARKTFPQDFSASGTGKGGGGGGGVASIEN